MLPLPQLFHCNGFEAQGVLKGTVPLPTFTGCSSFIASHVSLVPQRSAAATGGWLKPGQEFFSHAAVCDLWVAGGGCSTVPHSVFRNLAGCAGAVHPLPYCLLSLDTLCASQFTLVFQLSLRASLNFTLKCFSASSSVFPRARESCRQEAQITA